MGGFGTLEGERFQKKKKKIWGQNRKEIVFRESRGLVWNPFNNREGECSKEIGKNGVRFEGRKRKPHEPRVRFRPGKHTRVKKNLLLTKDSSGQRKQTELEIKKNIGGREEQMIAPKWKLGRGRQSEKRTQGGVASKTVN